MGGRGRGEAGRRRWRPWPLPVILLALLLAACSGGATATPPPATAPLATATAPGTATAPPAPSPGGGPGATGTRPPGTIAGSPIATAPGDCAPGVDLLGFADTLDKARFAETNVGGLSALAYDATRAVYYSLVDNDRDTPARLYTLRLPLDGGALGTPEVLAVATLRDAEGQPYNGRTFDGEGLALLPDGTLLISSETEPSIRRFTLDGRQIGELPVPARFLTKPRGEASGNQTFESLAATPDGATVFTATEGPLAPDGFAGLRPRIRILRYDRQPDGRYTPAAQYAYLAEPAQGVADMLALSATDLLVLERGFIPGIGNTIRLHLVSLAGAADVTGRASLAEPDLTPVPKALLVDLGQCPAGGATHPAKQGNPLLDNIESVALGPRLPDGRRALMLQSDDNFGRDQVTRVIALAWADGRP